MDSITEHALARWFAAGVTSRTNSVLEFALSSFLRPLGIETAGLEMEPFSGLESGSGEWWLREPRWNPASFDRNHPSASDFGYLIEARDRDVWWRHLHFGEHVGLQSWAFWRSRPGRVRSWWSRRPRRLSWPRSCGGRDR